MELLRWLGWLRSPAAMRYFTWPAVPRRRRLGSIDVRGSTAQASKVEKGSGIGMKRLRFSPSRGALRQVLDGEAGSGAAAGDQSTAAAKG
jgi:hypothetical protein